MSQSRQLAAIMFTDIVGYTKLMGEDEQKAFELLKKNRSVQRPIIEKFNGRWLKEIGDGVLASFSTVSDAVFCAKEIQETCQNEPDLRLRIGIHLGEVVFEGNDVFGDGVNIASRLEPLAPIGGILVSESVHRNLGNKKDIESTFIREEQLKNVKEPIRIYSVQVEGMEPVVILESSAAPQPVSPKTSNLIKMTFAAVGVLIILLLSYLLYSNFSAQQSQGGSLLDVTDKSIAVLPFRNDSPDQDNEYFANGMVEEILNYLQKISALEVKARTSVEQYRNPSRDIKAIAKELEVAFIIEGSVRKFEDDIRVTAQLIEAKTGNHLWSETYDGKYTDQIFKFQSEIAKKIAASLNVIIIPKEEEIINEVPATDIVAYDLYIRANHERWTYQLTTEDKHAKAAHDLFNQALKVDPDYLMAIVGKADLFNVESKHDSALVYAEKAIVLNPKYNRGYATKGYYYLFNGRFDLFEEYLLKAISLPPYDDFWLTFHSGLGVIYCLRERNGVIRGLPYLKKGIEMEGTQYISAAYNSLAVAYVQIGDYEVAGDYFRTSLELEANCTTINRYSNLLIVQGKFSETFELLESECQVGHCDGNCSRILFELSWLIGEFENAMQYYDQWKKIGQPSLRYDRINYEVGYVYYQLGRKEEAQQIFTAEIQKLESELNMNSHGQLINLSRIFAFQGDRVKAIKYLTDYANKGFRFGRQDFILIDPFFESLKDDPKFKAIVKSAQEERAALRGQVREMEERGELTLQ